MRLVNIIERDNRIDAKEAFELHFVDNNTIKVIAKLPMGPALHNLMQHWLMHNDDLFVDVLSGVERGK